MKPSIEAQTLYDDIVATDGREIERDEWPIAEELVAQGMVTLGPARGPGRNWRRAEVCKVPAKPAGY